MLNSWSLCTINSSICQGGKSNISIQLLSTLTGKFVHIFKVSTYDIGQCGGKDFLVKVSRNSLTRPLKVSGRFFYPLCVPCHIPRQVPTGFLMTVKFGKWKMIRIKMCKHAVYFFFRDQGYIHFFISQQKDCWSIESCKTADIS